MRSDFLPLPADLPDVKRRGKNAFYALYKREIEEAASKARQGGKPLSLLLHSCCGPCSSAVISRLAHLFRVTVFYYNPNIDTAAEYARRAESQRRVIAAFPVNYIEETYDSAPFCKAAFGLETEKEGGKRCEACFRLRLEKTAEKAAKLSADFFCTTLTVSPMKSAETINLLGFEAGQAFGVKWLWSDFKKEDGYALSVRLSKEFGLYRQDYCGCAFSKREKANEAKLVGLAQLR